MRQIGIGLHSYHDSNSEFPSGYEADVESDEDGTAWGRSVSLLPFIEQNVLFEKLNSSELSIDEVAASDEGLELIQEKVSLFLCPSDDGDGESHQFRFISVSTGSTGFSNHVAGGGNGGSSGGPNGGGNGGSNSDPIGQLAKSNYVGSLGNDWKSVQREWEDSDFKGNGLFGRNSAIRIAMVTDGTSNTIAVGERSFRNYAAVWIGVNSWQLSGFADNQMVLGTAFYPINDEPVDSNIGSDGQGSANFSSFHPGSANFLFTDGAVHFVSDSVQPQPRGVYHNLAQRNDGEVVGEF